MSPTKAKEIRPEKIEAVKEIKEKFQKAKIAIFTEYQSSEGLLVKEVQKLRRKLLQSKGEFKVVKNTLAKKALGELKLKDLDKYFEKPSAIAFGYDDPSATAKALFEFTKEVKKERTPQGLPLIKAAWSLEGILTADQVRFLASLPPKPILLSQLLGTMMAPVTGLVTVLSGTLCGVVTALDAIRKKREAAGESAGPKEQEAKAEVQAPPKTEEKVAEAPKVDEKPTEAAKPEAQAPSDSPEAKTEENQG